MLYGMSEKCINSSFNISEGVSTVCFIKQNMKEEIRVFSLALQMTGEVEQYWLLNSLLQLHMHCCLCSSYDLCYHHYMFLSFSVALS